MTQIIPFPDQFSDHPGSNYIQLMLTLAVQDGSTDIYFRPENGRVRVYRNGRKSDAQPNDYEASLIELKREIFSSAAEEFGFTFVIPDGFSEELSLPRNMLVHLEEYFREVYRLEDLCALDTMCALRDIRVGGHGLATGLGRDETGKAYHLHLNYLW